MTQKKVDPAWILAHGKDIREWVVTQVDAAAEAINADGVANLEGGDFSITLALAATGYPIAAQFAFHDAAALAKESDEMAESVVNAARNWARAEGMNIAK